jgi:NitT/TauT family transport system permease protein
MKNLFRFGGSLSSKESTLLSVMGMILFLLTWQLVVGLDIVQTRFFPSPHKVFSAFLELLSERDLVHHALYSIKLNVFSFVIALCLAIPTGFLLGLSPLARGLSLVPVKGITYVPLSAVTILFIVWFGMENVMRISFLAFSIFIYVLPIVIDGVLTTKKVYINTAVTLGASKWKTFTDVYLPDTLSRVWDNIVVLISISWTYIVIAELINRKDGLGALIYMVNDRQSRIDMAFAILFLIMFIGYTQDKLFRYVGILFFPFKKEQK